MLGKVATMVIFRSIALKNMQSVASANRVVG
jgi:hypothetical protein